VKKWDRTRPRIYDPRLGEFIFSAPRAPLHESTLRERPGKVNEKKKRKRKSRSKSVWCIP